MCVSVTIASSCLQRCHGCEQKPIIGPRFRCQVCLEFDYCQKCFEADQKHRSHAFERTDDPSQPAVFVGTPQSHSKLTQKVVSKRKQRKVKGGSVIMDWDQIVVRGTVSSNEGAASHLWDNDPSTYWQSSGPQGKVGVANMDVLWVGSACMFCQRQCK